MLRQLNTKTTKTTTTPTSPGRSTGEWGKICTKNFNNRVTKSLKSKIMPYYKNQITSLMESIQPNTSSTNPTSHSFPGQEVISIPVSSSSSSSSTSSSFSSSSTSSSFSSSSTSSAGFFKTPFTQESLGPVLPVLKAVYNHVQTLPFEIDLSKTLFICGQHLLNTTVSLFELLMRLD